MGIASNYPSYVIFVAIFVAAAIVCVLMPGWIKLLRRNKIGQQIRADGPQRHLQKQGTPTMGGVVILTAVIRYSDYNGCNTLQTYRNSLLFIQS